MPTPHLPAPLVARTREVVAGLRDLVLEGTLVRLQPLRAGHAAAFAAATAGAPADLYAFSGAPLDRDHAERYVAAALADERTVAFAIERVADGRVVGSTRWSDLEVWEVDRPHPSVGTLGYTWLAPDALRTGVNREAKLLLLDLAFDTWRMQRAALYADARNERSRTAVERLGFRLDGLLRLDRLGHRGEARTTAHYSLLPEEWAAVRPGLALGSSHG